LDNDIFKLLADSAVEAISITDLEGRVLYANKSQRELTGFGDAVPSSRLADYFEPEVFRFIEEEVLPEVQRDGRWQGDLRLRRPDGSSWLAAVNGYLLYDAEQQPWAFAATFRDVTEQRRQEQALLRLQTLIEHASFGVGITAPDGTVLYANPTYAEMLGFSDSIAGANVRGILPPEDLRHFEQVVMPELMERGRWEGVRSFGRVVDEPRMIDSSFVLLRDEQQRIEGVAAVVRDITAELQAAQAMIELNERLEQSFMTTPLGTIEFDVNGLATRWNKSAERIFGWTSEEALGRNVVELLVPDLAREHVEHVIAQLLDGQITNSRNENITRDGRRITCQWYNAVLRDAESGVIGVLSQVEDVSERMRDEQRLSDSENYLRAIFHAMDDIVFIFNREGVYVDIAPTKPELLYATSEFLRGKRIVDVVPPDAAQEYMRLILEVLDSGETRKLTYMLAVQAGETWFDAVISRLDDERVLWVARDITGRMRDEREKLELQEQVIVAQRAALRELNSPIIPIGEGVVAMPLIGSIDSARAQQIIEMLLQGVSARRAHIAILDITGVQVVDTQVANALLRAAQAVKLLGAQVIITGIRPEVAQTLVGLGADLSGITTRGTLQSGISYALSRR
jgi:rsbT co-antagonist protein RsbR